MTDRIILWLLRRRLETLHPYSDEWMNVWRRMYRRATGLDADREIAIVAAVEEERQRAHGRYR